jgi:hypothetical protein
MKPFVPAASPNRRTVISALPALAVAQRPTEQDHADSLPHQCRSALMAARHGSLRSTGQE